MEHTVRCDRYFLLLLLAIGVSSLLSDLSVSSNNPFDSDDGGIMKIVICLSNVMQAGEDGGYCDEVSTAEPLPIAPGAGGGGGRARRGRESRRIARHRGIGSLRDFNCCRLSTWKFEFDSIE